MTLIKPGMIFDDEDRPEYSRIVTIVEDGHVTMHWEDDGRQCFPYTIDEIETLLSVGSLKIRSTKAQVINEFYS